MMYHETQDFGKRAALLENLNFAADNKDFH